ncbi:SU10 major capsid protein [Oceanobacillus kimchii]|uniref:SU10 major capsid protein n=1 Tax=Oceanobacillus kimchii TaxID=746691 RepID=UPI003B015FF9
MFNTQDFLPGQSFDMKDVLIEVNKKQNPFTTLLLSKTVPATAPHVQWMQEEINSASAVTMPEGGDAPAIQKDSLYPKENWLELIGATAGVTNTAQASTATGISDLLSHEVTKKTKAIKAQFENRYLHGTGGGYDTASKTYKTNGILEQIHKDNRVTGADLQPDTFDETIEKLYLAGASDNMICFVPARMKKKINSFESVTYLASEKFLGFDIDRYDTVYGTVSFVLCEGLTDQLFVVNPDYLELAQLIPFHATVQSVSGSKMSVYLEEQAGVKLLNEKAAASFAISTDAS